jgi:diaminopimelate epimerase
MENKFKNYPGKTAVPFVKMQGCGNDFIIMEGKDIPADFNLSELAKNACERNFGIGADGIILVLPSEKADFRMQIINSDGSEPEMCGNGIRCFAKYLELSGKTDKKELDIETLAGLIKATLVEKNGETLVRVDMGEPRLNPHEVPVWGFEGDSVINQQIRKEDKPFNITAVSMGNPHCVIFMDDLDSFDFDYWGPRLESYTDVFPKKTNVEFVKVEDKENLRLKVWERGAGPTLACGTGACATLVAAVLNNLSDKKASVHLPGGTLEIEWAENNHLIMTGPAEVSFAGVF